MPEPVNQSVIKSLRRRTFLRRTGVGIGAAALQSLMLGDRSIANTETATARGGRSGLPHHLPRQNSDTEE